VPPSNRRLDNRFNIFEGVHKNSFFLIINVIMVGGQVLIIFVGGRAFHITLLDGPQWAISVVLGALSLPFGVLIRLIPDEWFGKLIPYRVRKWWMPDSVTDTESRKKSISAENLGFLRRIRGGRINHLMVKFDHYAEDSGLVDSANLVALTGMGYGR
jgi:P-type Ca2+ transporter type 2C